MKLEMLHQIIKSNIDLVLFVGVYYFFIFKLYMYKFLIHKFFFKFQIIKNFTKIFPQKLYIFNIHFNFSNFNF